MTATAAQAVPAEGTVGQFKHISIEDYHACHGAVSKSALDDFHKAPIVYWANRFDPNKPAESDEETSAQLKGNLLHCAVLEPDEFGKRYTMIPEDAPRRPSTAQRNAAKPSDQTIKDIAWWDDFNLKNDGKTVVKPEYWDRAWRMSDSLRRISAIRELMDTGYAEASEFSVDPITGLWIKTRPDWQKQFGEAGDILLDLKTVGTADPEAFARRQVPTMRYHVQDALYTDNHERATGRKVIGFLFGIVETEWPYYARVCELDAPSKEEGRRAYKKDLAALKRAKDANAWHMDGEQVATISLPPYAFEEKPE